MATALFPARRVMWMPPDFPWQPPSPGSTHCCGTMTESLVIDCGQHDDPFDCPDVPLVHHEVFGEYGVPIRDDGMSYLVISHCPWCGARLPNSSRDRWFDRLDAEGLADTPFLELPVALRTAAWRLAPRT